MTETPSAFEIRRMAGNTPGFRDALHLALGVEPPAAPAVMHPVVEDFLATAKNHGRAPELVFGAFRDGRREAACAALESPGSSGMIYSAATTQGKKGQDAAVAALRTLVDEAHTRRVALLEALIAPDDLAGCERLQRAGFRFLTRLIYLRRRNGAAQRAPAAVPHPHWVIYSGDTHASFLEAIEQSYRGSLDCPELTGIRPVEVVLAGHRAIGEFDPLLWSVGLWNGRPAAVILLNKLPRSQVLEVVYMGVLPDFRGRGLANALLARAVESCRVRSCRALMLAVDERNVPARRVYDRWGFVETGVRAVWIASPVGTSG